MRAKLLKEQMGVLAGTEMDVLGTGRAWTLRAPSGAEIVVPACDAEMVPDTEPFSEPKPEVDPEDPGLLVNIFGGQPQPEAERTTKHLGQAWCKTDCATNTALRFNMHNDCIVLCDVHQDTTTGALTYVPVSVDELPQVTNAAAS